jgi:hypothetical protein
MVQCVKCGREFAWKGTDELVASISGSIMGDEYIESYFFCGACGVYTVEVYQDQFSGEESASVQGPISKEDGDAKVALIRQCTTPWDKKCRCSAHVAYFDGSLD